ncbi:acyl-CoA dehydrogenase family protein [Craterilacuibacter sp. RT1T]|uniref:acyl-CoA dehydrogenase family protein n=1 Tax=Craterilacuibacter sp. RT1T TaxID=2942211 RepID=UPI0020C04AD8|nr:acyl-CoA dehydrogenase family protein [Craterilacuibacter sp. RT1T]MCL6262988.1 acyl-CoA/acyl-ACP dehydrogenase [Craterilacuibacter sp. RT1T]
MNFSLTDEQLQIREMAAGLFTDFSHENRAGKLDSFWDPALWAELVDTGLCALLLPGEVGGAELGMTELISVLQEQGKALAAAPLWRHALACAALSRFAPALLDALDSTQPLALTLDSALSGRIDGHSVMVSGEVAALAVTPQTRHALLQLELGGDARLMLVELSAFERTAGVLTQGEAVWQLNADGLLLGTAQLLPPEAHAWVYARACACIAALQLGVAEGAQAMTVAHLSEREQFGRKLGSFQAVAQRMGDGFIAIEALRSVLWQLVWRLDAGVDIGTAAQVAKYWASETGNRIAHSAQHLHGGTGSDLSYPLHRFFLAARALELELGGAAAQIAALADIIKHNENWRAAE